MGGGVKAYMIGKELKERGGREGEGAENGKGK